MMRLSFPNAGIVPHVAASNAVHVVFSNAFFAMRLDWRSLRSHGWQEKLRPGKGLPSLALLLPHTILRATGPQTKHMWSESACYSLHTPRHAPLKFATHPFKKEIHGGMMGYASVAVSALKSLPQAPPFLH